MVELVTTGSLVGRKQAFEMIRPPYTARLSCFQTANLRQTARNERHTPVKNEALAILQERARGGPSIPFSSLPERTEKYRKHGEEGDVRDGE